MEKIPEVYGTATIGSKGQVVIPKEARKVLNIKPGDKLIALSGPPGRKAMISFIPAKHISQFLTHFEKHITELKTELSKKVR